MLRKCSRSMFVLFLDQVSDLEKELALYKIPQPEKAMDTTLVYSALDEVDSQTIKPRYSSIDDSELESKYSFCISPV